MGSIATDGGVLVVEIAFGSANPFTSSPSWTNVSAYVRSVNVRRGRWTELSNRVDAGTATVRLDNSDRRFDPTYTSGAYYPNVVPMKQIRIRMTYSATTYDLYRGFIDEWPQTWTKGNGGTTGLGVDSEVTITCTDSFGVFANNIVTDRYALEVLTDDPIGYWRCDDQNNEMADSGPSGFHGAWYGNTEPVAETRLLGNGARALWGSAAEELDIATRYNESTGSTGEQELQTGAVNGSIECYLYINPTSQGGVQYLDFGNGPILTITFDNEFIGSGAVAFSWQNVAATDEGFYYYPTEPFQVLHVVGTYLNSTGAAKLYVNGQDVSLSSGLVTTGGYLPLSLLPLGVFVFNALTEDVDHVDRGFMISDIAIYNTVLSAARVQAHYVAGKVAAKIERSGARVGMILDYLNWPSGLQILDEGDSWLDVGPIPATLLDYLQQIAETEQGRMHMSADGELIFRSRTDDVTRVSSTTSQATFGDSGSELRYSELVLDGGHVNSIRNVIQVTPQSGASLVASSVRDTASVAAYGPRGESLATLHYNQSDARNLGLWRLEKFADPQIVVRQLTFNPRRSPSTLFVHALDRDLGNRITVVRRPQGIGSAISQERTIEGIEHNITPDTWTCTWYLCEPTPSIAEGPWFTANDATYGLPNGTNLAMY